MKGIKRGLLGILSEKEVSLETQAFAIKKALEVFDFLNLSSIYDYDEGENEGGLSSVLFFKTDKSVEQTEEEVLNLNRTLYKKRGKVLLLNLESIVMRSPTTTLPAIELATQKKWCLPAVDVWEDFVHPIEETDLKSVLNTLETRERVTFFAQNKRVLDFC